MAANGVTLPEVRLILLLDPAADARWREPLVRAVHDTGRPLVDTPAPASADDCPDRAIIVSDDVNWLVLVPPPQAVIIWAGTLPEPFKGSMSAYDKALWLIASGRLSVACHVLALGGQLFASEAQSIALPDIGVIEAGLTRRVGPPHDSPLAMYRTLPPEKGASAVWPGSAFWYPAADASDGSSEDIDLTGRSRVVIHGPYLHLPPGTWRITAEIHVDPEGGRAGLRMEWGSDGDFTEGDFSFTNPGVYALEMEHVWATSGPAQLVVWVDKPLFQGRLRLETARVEMIG